MVLGQQIQYLGGGFQIPLWKKPCRPWDVIFTYAVYVKEKLNIPDSDHVWARSKVSEQYSVAKKSSRAGVSYSDEQSHRINKKWSAAILLKWINKVLQWWKKCKLKEHHFVWNSNTACRVLETPVIEVLITVLYSLFLLASSLRTKSFKNIALSQYCNKKHNMLIKNKLI